MVPQSSEPEEGRTYRLYGSGGMAASGLFPERTAAEPTETEKEPSARTAAVIGRFDDPEADERMVKALEHFPEIEVAAFADFDQANLAQNQGRFGAGRAYSDYREMLDIEKPDLVAIGSGFGVGRQAMVLSVLKAGAHVFYEGPIAQTLGQADQIAALAESDQLKVCVTNPLRFDPTIREFTGNHQGLIGELLEIRIYGRMGFETGGKDLAANAWPLFDLAREVAGRPEACFARIFKDGKPISRKDGRLTEAKELGVVAGDDVVAHYALEGGVDVTFISRTPMRVVGGPWGMEFVGTRCRARLVIAEPPAILFQQHAPVGTSPGGRPFTLRCPPEGPDAKFGVRYPAEDWLDAIANDREPVCSARAALEALEMTHAAFWSGLSGESEKLPLEDRSHPFAPRFAGPL